MKKLHILIAIALFFMLGACQNKVKGPKEVVLSMTQMNVLYFGLENPVSIAVAGIPAEEVTVNVDHGELSPTDKAGKYLFMLPLDASNPIREVRFFISYEDQTDTINARMLKVPNPTPFLGEFSGGEVPVSALPSLTKVNIRLEDFLWDNLKYEVTKFLLVLAPAEGKATAINITGSDLGKEWQEKIQALKKNDKIIVTEIFGMAPGISEKQFPQSIVLTIVE